MAKRGQDWTGLLARAGLEAPGYHEAVASANAQTEERRRAEAERQAKKGKRKRR